MNIGLQYFSCNGQVDFGTNKVASYHYIDRSQEQHPEMEIIFWYAEVVKVEREVRRTHINPNQIKAEKSEGGDGVCADGTKAFSNLPSFVHGAAPLKYRKHCKNCECCPRHS